jgi:hypothetical protein
MTAGICSSNAYLPATLSESRGLGKGKQPPAQAGGHPAFQVGPSWGSLAVTTDRHLSCPRWPTCRHP